MRKARLDAGPTRFAREFNLRHHGEPVTAQTGHQMAVRRGAPTQDKLRTLAQWLECLRTGVALRGEPERAHTNASRIPATYAVDRPGWKKIRLAVSEPHRKMSSKSHGLLRSKASSSARLPSSSGGQFIRTYS